jgi:high affinity sulfate transporter 1
MAPVTDGHVPGDPPAEGPRADEVFDEDKGPFVRRARGPILHRAVPITGHLQGYESASLGRDAVAGLTVAALAIPSAMGFAEVAGLPPVTGLYALLLPVVAYALLGSSRQLVVGPEGTSAALIAAGVTPLADGDPVSQAELAALLACLVAVAFLLARTVRLGWVADYLSRAALVGFVHGVVITLVCGQLGKVFGLSIGADRPPGQVVEVIADLDQASVTTLVTGVVALVLLFGSKALVPKAPGPLIVVVLGIAAAGAFDLADHGVAVLGSIPSGLPSVTVPRGSLHDAIDVVPVALGIVFATYADSILTARSFAGRHDQHVNADQELLALGVANLTAGFTQSFPMGNSNSRTAVNDQMGVRTQVAGLVSAVFVGLVLLFLTGLVEELPAAVLGAVVIYAAVGLVSLAEWRAVRTVSHADFAIAVVALVGVVLLGVLEGILLAVVLSVVNVVRRSARPSDAVLGWVPRLARYADVNVHPSARVTPGVVVYRLDDRLFFANAEYVKGRILEAIAGSPSEVHTFVFDGESLTELDSTGVEALESVVAQLGRQGVRFRVARLRAWMKERFDRSGLTELIGEAGFHASVRAAVAAARSQDASDGA